MPRRTLATLPAVEAVSVVLRFPDGTVLTGADAADVLERLGVIQWEPCDGSAMKHRLSDRVWNWCGVAVDPLLSDDEFLAALNRSRMILVERIPRKAP